MLKQPFTMFALVMAVYIYSLPEKLLAAQKPTYPVTSQDFTELFTQYSESENDSTYFPDSLVPNDAIIEPISPQRRLVSEDLTDLFTQPSNSDNESNYFPDSFIPSDTIAEPIRLELRLSRRQVSVYRGKKLIKSYPVAVGKPGWETPTGNFQVMTKIEKPTWINPFTDKSIKGGDPENPLGKFWIGFWTDGRNSIGFHGTPTPSSVGRAASHGCVRMYNKDVEELFKQVSVGTPVAVLP